MIIKHSKSFLDERLHGSTRNEMIYYSLLLSFLPHAPAQQQPGLQGRPRPRRARLVLPDFPGHSGTWKW